MNLITLLPGNITRNSTTAELFKQAKVIIWDEAPMAHKKVLECIDRTLRDIMQNEQPFGGKVLILCGDFRQILSVCPRASRAQIVNSAINRSHLWQHFKVFHFKTNERVKRKGNSIELEQFAQTLKNIGDGNYPVTDIIGPDMIKIPNKWLSRSKNIQELIEEAFPNLEINYQNTDFLKGRAILTPKNIDANSLNNMILDKFPGDVSVKLSVDENVAEKSVIQIADEVMNKLNPSSLPPHELKLKKNAIIMLLRNLDLKSGACNGTRMKILRFTDYVIEAEILTGPKEGNRFFITRIRLYSNKQCPIPFIRQQFPIKLASVMTINKAQGQTLQYMCLYLPEPVFSHGQLYVACGRVGSANNLSIYIVNGKSQGIFDETKNDGVYTKNVVYKEVFDDEYGVLNFDDINDNEEKIIKIMIMILMKILMIIMILIIIVMIKKKKTVMIMIMILNRKITMMISIDYIIQQ